MIKNRNEQQAEVARLRSKGMMLSDVADEVGITYNRAEYLSKLAGCTRHRGPRRTRDTLGMIGELVRDYDSVTIELSADESGYLVSVDDQPGEVHGTVRTAVKAAYEECYGS